MSRAFSTVFAIDVETPDITKVAVSAVRHGYAVVPVHAMSKVPDMCTLNARELGKQGKKHLCGVHHAITDPEQARKVFAKFGPDLNIGVVAYPSRLIVIDADNEAGVRGFIDDMITGCDDPGYSRHTPTVLTPGMKNDAGAWVHKDGGHFLFELPAGIELALGRQKIIDTKGYEIRWGWSMSLVPPSQRIEGPYQSTATAVPVAPQWLIDRITANSEGYLAKLDRPLYHNDSIARWSASVTWGELLGADGWTELGKLDSCGCPTFTKPGGGTTNDRSATGHEPHCGVPYLNVEGHAPLHLWTTEPPPPLDQWISVHGQTMTKLQYLAVSRFDGDQDLAMIYLGIAGPGLGPSGWVESLPPAESPVIPADPRDDMGSGITEPDPVVPEPSQPHPQDQLEQDHEKPLTSTDVLIPDPSPLVHGDQGSEPRDVFWRADESEQTRTRIRVAAERQEIEARARELREHRISGGSLRMRIKGADTIMTVAVEASVAHRSDGVALLYRGRVNTIWGPSESAKSWFSLACAIDVLSRGGSVLIIDTEDDESGFDSRMTTLGWPKHPRASYVQLMMAPTSIERDELLAAARAADLVVVDSLDGLLAILALESNNATAVRTAGAMLKQWAQAGNAAVLVVDHVSEKPQEGKASTALGSSAKKQLIDGVMLRADRETEWKPQARCTTMIMLGKDRHGQVKQWAEYRGTEVGERAFGRLARLEMVSYSKDAPSTLSLLKPPSFEDEPENAIRATQAEIKAIESRLISALTEAEGKLISRTDLLAVAGDKNDRKGFSNILDELCRRNPPDGDMGGIKVHSTKHGNEIRLHYSWVSPDSKGDNDSGA